LYKDGFWCTDELPQAQMHLLGAPSTVKYTPSKYTRLLKEIDAHSKLVLVQQPGRFIGCQNTCFTFHYY